MVGLSLYVKIEVVLNPPVLYIMTPEQRARQQIDLLLQQSGWIVQDLSEINLSAGLGVAVREATMISGEAESSELILN